MGIGYSNYTVIHVHALMTMLHTLKFQFQRFKAKLGKRQHEAAILDRHCLATELMPFHVSAHQAATAS